MTHASVPQTSTLLPFETRTVHVGEHTIVRQCPKRDIAYLSYDASWPPYLQHLWQSCSNAYMAYVELGEVLTQHPRDTALAELELCAYRNWAAIEEYALPLFVAYDATLFY